MSPGLLSLIFGKVREMTVLIPRQYRNPNLLSGQLVENKKHAGWKEASPRETLPDLCGGQELWDDSWPGALQ